MCESHVSTSNRSACASTGLVGTCPDDACYCIATQIGSDKRTTPAVAGVAIGGGNLSVQWNQTYSFLAEKKVSSIKYVHMLLIIIAF